MNQDEQKRAAARAAIQHIPAGCIVGVGTGSTANYFIDELADIRSRIDGTVASSEATARRLGSHGIEVMDLNNEAGHLGFPGMLKCSTFKIATHFDEKQLPRKNPYRAGL